MPIFYGSTWPIASFLLPPQSIAANGIFSSKMPSGTIQATVKRFLRRA